MRLPGEGVPFVSGIDTPEIGSRAKCIKETTLALIAKGRLKDLLTEQGLRIEWRGAVGKTHQRLQNEWERDRKRMLQEGSARTWSPIRRNDWCG